MHSFSSLYNENTVISKEYTGPLDFDITGVDCTYKYIQWHLPTLVWIRNIARIRKVTMYSKTFICVQRLCRIEIIQGYTCVGLVRFHLNRTHSFTL